MSTQASCQVEFGTTVIRSRYQQVAILRNGNEVGHIVKDRDRKEGGYRWFALPAPGHEDLFGAAEVRGHTSLEATKDQVRRMLGAAPDTA